ncbi:hypothetical protein MMC22_007961 [Lobaria immixta]|nr:hypothetical protein [Lobaria immixta]
MDRADSGFGEGSMNTNEARESLSRDSHQIQHCNTPSLDSPPENLKAALDPISQHSESNARTQTDSSKSRMSTLPTSARPTLAQRNITRRSSGTPSSHRGSTPPSRRSSFAAPQPVNSYNRRPLFPNKSISAAYGRSLGEDPFLAHRRSKQIFQTFDAPQRGQSQMRPDDQRSLASPSLPDLPRVPSTPAATAITQAEEANPDLQHQYANHVPATVIDWTLPSTRRLEYREIDKSCQGFRGMWRRLAPRWCRRNSRLSFFDGNDSDAGSVRRYRLDLPEVKKENKADSVDITEQEIALGLRKTKRKWSLLCFNDWPRR